MRAASASSARRAPGNEEHDRRPPAGRLPKRIAP